MPKLKKKSVSKKKPIKLLKKKATKKAIAKRKSKKVSAIPKGYNNITPYLIVESANSAIDFYKKVFGAKEKFRMQHNDGMISHAELQIGDTKIMLSDECQERQTLSPKKIGGSPVSILLYIKNVDVVTDKAISLGAKLIRPIQDMFYGDRSGTIEDPYGHIWTIATHIEDVTPAKAKKRAAELFGKKL